MQVYVKTFGKITDILPEGTVELPMGSTVAEIRVLLHQLYPALQTLTYKIAVNARLSEETIQVQEGDTLALLPPYSGG
ncbi:MAG: MoaD/ThiS family protein [Cytophagaceae bacterium]|jgi:molybdopterin synthase sulfur carrier subunit|nr:MoaD/ThiS family protein [Cytophagaceae bacterium]